MAKNKNRKAPATATLLVELLTEELPPKSVRLFGEVFADRVFNGLMQCGLITNRAPGVRVFATARRLGVLIPQVYSKAQDRTNAARLMPAKVAFDAEGNATVALQKRLEKEGLTLPGALQILERRSDEGAE